MRMERHDETAPAAAVVRHRVFASSDQCEARHVQPYDTPLLTPLLIPGQHQRDVREHLQSERRGNVLIRVQGAILILAEADESGTDEKPHNRGSQDNPQPVRGIRRLGRLGLIEQLELLTDLAAFEVCRHFRVLTLLEQRAVDRLQRGVVAH